MFSINGLSVIANKVKAENLCFIIMLPFHILQTITSIKITHLPKGITLHYFKIKRCHFRPTPSDIWHTLLIIIRN